MQIMTIQEALENLDVFFDYLNESGCLSKLEKEIMNLTQDTICDYIKATLEKK